MTEPRGRGAERLARLLSAVFFRSVECRVRGRAVTRPVLFVANHGKCARRSAAAAGEAAARAALPREAHAVEATRSCARFLALTGAIPVFAARTAPKVRSNDATFERCRQELEQGGAIALFRRASRTTVPRSNRSRPAPRASRSTRCARSPPSRCASCRWAQLREQGRVSLARADRDRRALEPDPVRCEAPTKSARRCAR